MTDQPDTPKHRFFPRPAGSGDTALRARIAVIAVLSGCGLSERTHLASSRLSGQSENSCDKTQHDRIEIRILGSDGRPSLFSEWIHVSLNAAVRSAREWQTVLPLKYG
jgi:hypothetical protein